MSRTYFLNEMNAIVKICYFEIATSAKAEYYLYVSVTALIISHFSSFFILILVIELKFFVELFVVVKVIIVVTIASAFFIVVIVIVIIVFIFDFVSEKLFINNF